MLSLLATSLIAVAVPAAYGACPEGVIDQLDGLYHWQVKRMEATKTPPKLSSASASASHHHCSSC